MTSRPIAKHVSVVGQVFGSRHRCRNCGRPMVTPAGQPLYFFCSVSCFERYPLDACASMAMPDLVRLVTLRRLKSVTDAIATRAELEAAAVAVLREEPADLMNLNPDGYMPSWIATRRGADKKPYNEARVEPEGVAPVKALAAERAYILARGGGMPLLKNGHAPLPPQLAAHMAASTVQDLPEEAMENLAGMLGTGKDAKRIMGQLGGPKAAAAHDRAHAAQLTDGSKGARRPKR